MNDLNENTEPIEDELTLLKERADKMGISYHPAIGVEKLKTKINDKLNGTPADTVPKAAAKKPPETIQARNTRLRREANRLIRVRVTCMNPNKKDWPGEIFTISNSIIGTVKKYVPFGAEAGYHIPQVIYEHMEGRRFQYFKKIKLPNGREKMESGLAKEFSIELLDPLTKQQLKDLADRQAMNHSIDA
jgi:hypothetical protein